jgi:hypothetical protein
MLRLSSIYFTSLNNMMKGASAYSVFKYYCYIPIAFVLLLYCSVVMPPNILLLFESVTVGNQCLGF